MYRTNERILAADVAAEVAAFRHKWPWFVLLGVILFLVGVLALGSLVIASLATALAIGWLLFVAGVTEMIGAFWSRHWSGFFVHLLSALLSIVVALLILRAPVGGALALTMLLSCLLIVGGIFKIVTSFSYRFDAWGWPLLGGIVDLILGVMIWQEWPASGLWVIGMFVGISLVFRGFHWIALGIAFGEQMEAPIARKSKADGQHSAPTAGTMPSPIA